LDQSGLEDEPEMTIRKARESDLIELSELIKRSIKTLNSADDSPQDMEFVIAKYDVPRLRQHLLSLETFVLEIDSKLVGMAILKNDGLHSLFVEPKYAGRGCGRMLVKHIENIARSKQVLVLKVSSSRTAVPFYEKLGFQKLHFEPREFAPTWAMEKRL
jgi:N-acetylglutamate synthase-like GNAT family acetyltransferase